MPPDLRALQRVLSDVVGAEHVQAGPAAAEFSCQGVAPSLAVRPASQAQVAAVVAACGSAGAHLMCWGGGTSMGVGNAPSRLAVALCLDRLSQIVEFDDANLNVTAEAGVRLADLQALLATKREFLPLDPPGADRVTVGGLVASNASGPGRLLYGTARDWILGLRVVLPTGERIRCGGKVIKNVSGYDMNKLFVGSLGTLGVVTEATFKLLPVPARRAMVVAVFSELAELAAVVRRTLESYLVPEAIEALDPGAAQLVEAELGRAAPPGYTLVVSAAGSPETVQRQVHDLTRFFTEAHAITATTLDASQAVAAWGAVRDVHARLGGRGDQRVVCRIAVPIGKTLELMASAERLARQGGQCAVAAHAGSGIVRAGWIVNGSPAPVREGLEALRAQAESAEGSLVLEAAPAEVRRTFDAWGNPRQSLSVMRRLKSEFDPQGVMSAGRFVGGI